MQKQKTGKQTFDRTSYSRELCLIENILWLKDHNGNATRVITEADMHGINNALKAKFNAIGTEKAAQDYTKSIDDGPWPITVTVGETPDWVIEFTEFLQSAELTLKKVPSSNRLWQISKPKNGYFGGKLAKTIANYMSANNLLGNATRKIVEELDADLIVEWEVYKSSSSPKL